jgi:hypothetical protein
MHLSQASDQRLKELRPFQFLVIVLPSHLEAKVIEIETLHASTCAFV